MTGSTRIICHLFILRIYEPFCTQKVLFETVKLALAKARNACYCADMDTREKLIQLKKESGYNWKAFAAYFDIPYRTMQDWYMGKRKMPEYLLRLMYYKLGMEKIIGDDAADRHEGVAYDTINQNR